jgi:HEAT repeat protein
VPRKPRLEELLGALRGVREDPSSEASLRELRRALASRLGHAAGKAAQIAGQFELTALAPDLVAAFDFFLAEPAADAGCVAKAGIVEALYRLGHEDPDVFLRGLKCVQMEPVFGGRVDTAVDVRGAAALGLVRCGYRDALVELAALLADREPPARISAARAVAYRGGEDGAPLLRLKILSGDAEPRVLTECLVALLQLSPVRSLAFVERFLDDGDPARREAAALALGESRLAEAFEPLRLWRERLAGGPDERLALLALAALRRDEAFDYLLALVREAEVETAARAVAALGAWRADEALAARVREAAARRQEKRIRGALERAFRAV